MTRRRLSRADIEALSNRLCVVWLKSMKAQLEHIQDQGVRGDDAVQVVITSALKAAHCFQVSAAASIGEQADGDALRETLRIIQLQPLRRVDAETLQPIPNH